jgi:cytochrome c biogenesis protein CcdA
MKLKKICPDINLTLLFFFCHLKLTAVFSLCICLLLCNYTFYSIEKKKTRTKYVGKRKRKTELAGDLKTPLRCVEASWLSSFK